MNRFDISDISKPLIVAPMAGGPSTPQLAAAASNAGGLGMLAGGLLSPDVLAETLDAARGLTSAPLGVNLFVPQPSAGTQRQYTEYAKALAAFAETVVTRAFTGRYARALRNGFVDRYGMQAPFGFPQIGFMTAPLHSAAGEADDPHGMGLLAGTSFRQARNGSVAEIVRSLT